MLLGGFAALALLLGAAGIYAVISYTVAQRRAEIGVRMALGAQPGRVLGMVLGNALRLAGLGIALGVVAAMGATQLLAGFLYGVGTTDPWTFAAVASVLLLVAAAASLIPAMRAMRVDPLEALRS